MNAGKERCAGEEVKGLGLVRWRRMEYGEVAQRMEYRRVV